MYYIETIPGLKLYHGTHLEHDTIDLSCSKRQKDFGCGYYLTSYFSQAEKWAKRHRKNAYVYEYKLFPFPEGLKILELLNYDKSWLHYISMNRTTYDCPPDYDIVYDRLADNIFSKINDVISQYQNGSISEQDAIKLLRWKHVKADQFCFKTEKAISLLKRTRTFVYSHNSSGEWTQSILP